MNIHELREAQVHFESQIDTVLKAKDSLYRLRDSFVSYYTVARISSMPMANYALGNDLPDKGYNFCYTIERELDGLGRIIGATAFKFGVYYGRTRSDDTYKYRFTKKFGTNLTDAYQGVKDSIIKLLDSGLREDIDEIVSNPLSPMFKGKILSTYYPERYLNIFSDTHLEYFLVQLNLDTESLIWSEAVLKREALFSFKNSDSVMKDWPLDIFTHFLYNVYPGRPLKPGETAKPKDSLEDYRNPNFPAVINPSWVELDMKDPSSGKTTSAKKGSKESKNPDYEKEARKLKKLGDRGEKIVLDMEKERLRRLGYPNLAKKVKKAKFDYEGFDIKSFETNGDPRYIEVKATRSKVGTANFFLSANELSKAKSLDNYFIYMVYDILSTTPKVWVINNPFNPENEKVVQTPISYRVVIKAEKK